MVTVVWLYSSLIVKIYLPGCLLPKSDNDAILQNNQTVTNFTKQLRIHLFLHSAFVNDL